MGEIGSPELRSRVQRINGIGEKRGGGRNDNIFYQLECTYNCINDTFSLSLINEEVEFKILTTLRLLLLAGT